MNRVLMLGLLAAAAACADNIPVVVRAGAASAEKIAAAELSRGLAAIYPDHTFPVTETPVRGRSIRLLSGGTSVSPDGFAVKAGVNGATVTGGTPRGALFGVYALLERLGFGFYLSYETRPVPRRGPIDFKAWEIADEPLFGDRIVFDWHNFLSSASTWELEDWERYIVQASRMRYDGIMVHAYGNNPMFTFGYNGKWKPVGYLATTRSGRDWGTQHVNDVRRMAGGEVFQSPVFGASIAQVAESQRSEAAIQLMQQVFGIARERDLGITFALDVDTESANPQEMIRTLPESARIRSGKYDLVNPETPEGFAYYRSMTGQLLKTYPQITRLAVWFRTNGTPWRDLKPEQFPDRWKTEWEAALAKTPELRNDPHAHGMFVMAKLVRAYGRALQEIGRKDVELAAGSWRLPFLAAADRFFPREVTLMPLDWETLFDTRQGLEQLTAVRSGRKLLPIIWAHHDDRTYIGRPYTPFTQFPKLLRERGGSGYGIIHWTTRPLDLYFKSIAEQSWKVTASNSLETTCEQMAARTFGEPARKSGAAYLLAWIHEGRMFGRETSDRFIDVPLKDAEEVIERCKRRLDLLGGIDEGELTPSGREWVNYFRDYERFTSEFFLAHSMYESGRDFAHRPEDAIRLYAQAARRGKISRGEEAIIVSLNLRWLPFLVSRRQALRLEPVRIKFQPTQHERLAQGPGRNSFYIDRDGHIWRALGEQETGAPAFDSAGGADEPGHSGIRIEKPLTLRLGAMMGEALTPGAYTLELILAARQASGEIELPGGRRERIDVLETQQGQVIRQRFEVRTSGHIDLTIRPVQNTLMLAGILIEPANR